MSIVHAIILGAVEGFTEFLPISSTGHLILAGSLLHIQETAFAKSFDIAIQLGAILSVAALYTRRFLDPAVLSRVIAAFIPTGVIGLLAYHAVKTYLLGDTTLVAAMLILGGVVMIAFEATHEDATDSRDIAAISHRDAFLIGIAQSFAIIPGISRSAASIMGGLALGLPRRTVVEFSFLIAVPTMAAATGLDLIKNASVFTQGDMAALAVGFIVAFATAWIGVRFLLSYIRTHDFTGFGIYRICAGIVAWVVVG